jgi:hypothetical protein
MTNIQSQVNTTQAPGIEGDFASYNPRGTVMAGEGALISGAGVIAGVSVPGAVVGRFAWVTYQSTDDVNAPGTVNTFGSGQPAGLVSRKQQGIITQYLAESVFYIQSGFQIAVYNKVDLWVKNNGTAAVAFGQTAYANFADGSVSFAALTASGTASSIAAATFSVTGSVAGDILTAASGLTGNIYPGATISGTGISTGSKIVSQLTPLLAGEALNGLGRYTLSIPEQSAASTAVSGTYGVFTAGGTITGTFNAGQTLTGTGITVTTTLYQQLTGTTGGAGTYVVDPTQTVTSTTITAAANFATKWTARNAAAVGELVKITDIP